MSRWRLKSEARMKTLEGNLFENSCFFAVPKASRVTSSRRRRSETLEQEHEHGEMLIYCRDLLKPWRDYLRRNSKSHRIIYLEKQTRYWGNLSVYGKFLNVMFNKLTVFFEQMEIRIWSTCEDTWMFSSRMEITLVQEVLMSRRRVPTESFYTQTCLDSLFWIIVFLSNQICVCVMLFVVCWKVFSCCVV